MGTAWAIFVAVAFLTISTAALVGFATFIKRQGEKAAIRRNKRREEYVRRMERETREIL